MATPDGSDPLRRAEALLGLRRYPEALTAAHQAIAGAPGDARSLVTAARAELGMERYENAEAAATSAVQHAPDWDFPHRVVALARLHHGHSLRTGRLQRRRWGRRAAESAETAVRLAPDAVQNHLVLAQCRALAGDLRQAKEASDRSIRLGPLLPDAWVVRSRVARLCGDVRVAEAAVREALRLDPTNYDANNELGLVYEHRFRPGLARRQFAATAALDPAQSRAPNNLLRGAQVTTWLLLLLVTCPLAVVAVPLWLLVALAVQTLLWRWGRSRAVLERTAIRLATRERRRLSRRRTRDAGPKRPVPVDTEIRGPYQISTVLVGGFAIGWTVIIAVPSTIVGATGQAPVALPVVAWLISVVLFVVVVRRRRLRPIRPTET